MKTSENNWKCFLPIILQLTDTHTTHYQRSKTMATSTTQTRSTTNKFLGVVDKRYIRTIPGIIHGTCSIIALFLGNIVYANRVLLGNQASTSTIHALFHVCNFVASLITALFFWNKVQSWQLSTTTMEEKGLTTRILQRFNRGRGIVTMLLYSTIPFIHSILPTYYLESQGFSIGVALAMIAGSAYSYHLIRDYSAPLWLVYGMTPMATGISILCQHSDRTVSSFYESYPLAMDGFQKEASFVISCVQLGFLMYYLYSRNLVTKSTVQKTCKTYHVTMGLLYFLRINRDLGVYLWELPSTIPWPMLIQPMLLSVLFSVKLLKLVVAIRPTNNPKKPVAPLQAERGSGKARRRSSAGELHILVS